MRGNVADTTPANATVEWYIFSDAPDHQSDLLLYSGAGYALRTSAITAPFSTSSPPNSNPTSSTA